MKKKILFLLLFVIAILIIPISVKADGELQPPHVYTWMEDINYNYAIIRWYSMDVDGYEVYKCTSTDTSTCTIIDTITDPSVEEYKAKNLDYNTTYYYAIKAYKNNGDEKEYSDFSDVQIVTTTLTASFVSIQSTSTTSIKLSWDKITGADGYLLYESVSGKWKRITDTTKTSYAIKGLKYGSYHTYCVKVYKTLNGKKIYSDIYSTGQPIGMVAPKITVTQSSNSKFKITWTKPEKVEHFTYIIRSLNDNDDDEWYYRFDDTTKTSYTVTGAYPGRKYSIYIAAVDSKKNAYEGTYQTYYSTFIKPTITTKQVSTTSIGLSWNDLGATTYYIARSTKLNGTYKVIATTSDLNYVDTNVTYGKTYYYAVKACTKSNDGTNVCGKYSAKVNRKTVVGKPKFTIDNYSYNSNKIVITKVEGASGYSIYRATSKNGKYTKIANTTSLEYVDKKLSFNKTYYYKLRSYKTVNKVKNYGGYSSILSIKTRLEEPYYKVEKNGDTAQITISKVAGATGYVVYKKTKDTSWVKYKTIKDISTPVEDTYDESIIYLVRAYRTVSKKNYYGISYYKVQVAAVDSYSPSRYLNVLNYNFSKKSNSVKAIYANDTLIDDVSPFTIDSSSIDTLPSYLTIEFNNGAKKLAPLKK